MNDKITMIARQATPITAMAPVTRSALACAKAQPPAKSAAPHAMIKHHSVTPKLKDGLGICMRESDLRRNRPPNLCPKPGLGSVRSKLRRISDRKSTRLNSSHGYISYAVFCLKKKKQQSAQSSQPTQKQTPNQ